MRPGYGYNQEVPPPHAYVKIAFVMKTDTGVIIADRMNKPMEFMMVRPVYLLSFHRLSHALTSIYIHLGLGTTGSDTRVGTRFGYHEAQ